MTVISRPPSPTDMVRLASLARGAALNDQRNLAASACWRAG
jgi:hypothetical protein